MNAEEIEMCDEIVRVYSVTPQVERKPGLRGACIGEDSDPYRDA